MMLTTPFYNDNHRNDSYSFMFRLSEQISWHKFNLA